MLCASVCPNIRYVYVTDNTGFYFFFFFCIHDINKNNHNNNERRNNLHSFRPKDASHENKWTDKAELDALPKAYVNKYILCLSWYESTSPPAPLGMLLSQIWDRNYTNTNSTELRFRLLCTPPFLTRCMQVYFLMHQPNVCWLAQSCKSRMTFNGHNSEKRSMMNARIERVTAEERATAELLFFLLVKI